MQQPKDYSDLFVIGIGASAGGLEALTELFDNIPDDTSCSFLIVQHLSPDYKSLMPELLSKHTRMPVNEAKEGMAIEPNSVYVIPHKKNMRLKEGKLHLSEKEANSHGPLMTIDLFLQSLAEEKGEKSIAIILSGTGSDGTKGTEAIKNRGGFVMVQDPLTAKFDGMPNNAIASGTADFVLAPNMLAEELINYLEDATSAKTALENFSSTDQVTVNEILNFLKASNVGDFTQYKKPTLLRRISKRVLLLKFNNLESYKDYLMNEPGEAIVLGKEFLIGVTKFFRDTNAFAYIETYVIPEIFKNKNPKEEIKFWVAGCSTGEEAYSIGILVQEYLKSTNQHFEIKIFATDIDKDAIEFASKGYYREENVVKDISPERIRKYFEREGSYYKVSQEIRKTIIFAQHDLIKSPPFGRLDFISCRNLLIYLTPTLQRNIFARFHFSLKPRGFLFLGSSESLGEFEPKFSEVSKKYKVFRNKPFTKDTTFESLYSRPFSSGREIPSKTSFKNITDELLINALAKESGYSALIINENYQITQALGDFKNFLSLPEKFDLNVLKMLPEGLSIPLSSLLRKALKGNQRVSQEVFLKEKNKAKNIEIVVLPFLKEQKLSTRLIFILLKEKKIEKKAVPILDYVKDSDNHERTKELEHELNETKENLQTAIEELETSNEEMQSANEELVSANEELQSTNEELQSVNEELHTVNAEHQVKIKQLQDLNDDLNNFFKSTEIGQIFIDKNLLIRKFTPAVTSQINLIETDIGRPINHITRNLNYKEFNDDIDKVLHSSEKIEKQIESLDGKWYQFRILPYERHDSKNDGLVLTFVDITQLKKLSDLFSAILNTSLNGIMAFKSIRNAEGKIIDFEWLLLNDKAEKLIEKPKTNLTGKRLLQEFPEYKYDELFEQYVSVVENGKPLHIEKSINYNNTSFWIEIAAVKLGDGLAVTFADISDKKNAEERAYQAFEELKIAQEKLKTLNIQLEERVEARTKDLSQSEERFRLVMLATNDVIKDWDLASNTIWWSDSLMKNFGYDFKIELSQDSWFSRIHKDDKARVEKSISKAIDKKERQWLAEYRFLKADGTYSNVLDRSYILINENNTPFRIIGSMMDITELKKTQEDLSNSNQSLKRINADLDNFIYTASHDLKAPIANIEGLVEALQEEIDESNPEVSDILKMVKNAIEKFKKTIHDLTEITKIDREIHEAAEDICLREMISEITSFIPELIRKYEAHIEILCEPCPKIFFPRKNFKSILYNLVSNAIKYSHPERKPVIKVNIEENKDMKVLTVSDNGLGIPQNKINKLFSMFSRFHSHVEGSGVGLFIVKRIIDNAGGRIEVNSVEEQGTTFKVYFPKNK